MQPEDRMYKLVCEKRFNEQGDLLNEVIRLLKGKNSDPGLCDNVRNNTKAIKRVYGLLIFLGGAITLQILDAGFHWLRNLLAGG